MKKILFGLLAVLALTGCEYRFDLHQDELENLIYVQCVTGAQDTTFINTTLAVPATRKTATKASLNITDMKFTVNGTPMEIFKGTFGTADYPVDRYYVLGKLHDGDNVEFKASASNAVAVSASTVIPDAPEVSNVSVSRFSNGVEDDFIRFVVDLDPNKTSAKYYGVQVEVQRTTDRVYVDDGSPVPNGHSVNTSYDYLSDPEMSEDILSQIDETGPITIGFDGANISGRYLGEMYVSPAEDFDTSVYVYAYPDNSWENEEIHEIYFGEETDPMKQRYDWEHWKTEWTGRKILLTDTTRYRLKVYSLTPEFYYYAKAQFFLYNGFDDLASLGLTPPNFTYGNVSGGMGLFGGVNVFVSDWFDNPLGK